MEKNYIDIATYNKMLIGGLSHLREKENIINDLNVFPVPDGDTGTNMRLTLESGLSESNGIEDNVSYLKTLSRGMLIGARGNSGVILSQIFRGINKKLRESNEIDANMFVEAIRLGLNLAYKSIENPVRGTMLTVLSLGADNTKIDSNETFVEFLKNLCLSMKEVLYQTPDMLQVLKDYDVVDAGGAGLLMIFEGMLNSFGINQYTELDISKQKPRYYKLKEHKPIAYITVCIGEKMKELYLDLGADIVISCSNTINASTNEFIEAMECANSDYTVIIPNNKNVYLSLNLAIEMSKKENVYILDTKSMIEGYFALSMMNRISNNVENELSSMKKGIDNLISIEYAKSNKDAVLNGNKCKKDDYIALSNDELIYASNDLYETLINSLSKFDFSDKEILVLIYNESISYDLISEIEIYLNNTYSNLEIGTIDGGDMLYELMIGIS